MDENGNSELWGWIDAQLKTRGWSQADLARRSGISSATITRIKTGERGIGPEVCAAIARSFGYPPELVMRKAGLIQEEKTELPSNARMIAHIIARLPDADQDELLQLAQMKLDRVQAADRVKELEELLENSEREKTIPVLVDWLQRNGWRVRA